MFGHNMTATLLICASSGAANYPMEIPSNTEPGPIAAAPVRQPPHPQ